MANRDFAIEADMAFYSSDDELAAASGVASTSAPQPPQVADGSGGGYEDDYGGYAGAGEEYYYDDDDVAAEEEGGGFGVGGGGASSSSSSRGGPSTSASTAGEPPVRKLSRWLEKLSFLHLLLSIVASLSYLTPGYNVGLGVWALFAAAHPTPRLLLTFTVFLLVSVVLDVAWIACYIVPIFRSISHGITATGNIYQLGLALVAANAALKLVTLFVGHRIFVVLGGHKMVATTLSIDAAAAAKDIGDLRSRIAQKLKGGKRGAAKRRAAQEAAAAAGGVEMQELEEEEEEDDDGNFGNSSGIAGNTVVVESTVLRSEQHAPSGGGSRRVD